MQCLVCSGFVTCETPKLIDLHWFETRLGLIDSAGRKNKKRGAPSHPQMSKESGSNFKMLLE